MNHLLRLCLLPLLLSFFAAPPAGAAELAVVIVSSEQSAAYKEAADAIVSELERAGLARKDVLLRTAAELGQSGVPTTRLFVALGTEATAMLVREDTKVPVLGTLLPRASFERILRESGRRASPQFTALYLNQPLTRQLELVRQALPQVRRVGVLLGAESQGQVSELEQAAQSRGLKLVSANVGPQETVFQGLKRILDEADLLLALADPQIYNSSSIQNILLTSFRASIPMLAFSPAYVRAGALLAVYSTPSQIGTQAGAMASGFLRGKQFGLPQYPQDFSVTVNEHVARSLGLSLDAQDLTQRLRRQEKGP